MNQKAGIVATKNSSITGKIKRESKFSKAFQSQKSLIIISLLFVIYIFVFYYLPTIGWLMAFQNFKPHLGLFKSTWAGWTHFEVLFKEPAFYKVLRNTLAMSFLNLIFSYLTSITLAIILNEVRNVVFKKTIQTVSYLPYFVSWAVTANIIMVTLSTDGGAVNTLLTSIGILKEPVLWLGEEKLFWLVMALTNVWKNVGWNAIIYLAAMTAIPQELYEAASIDGASRIMRIFKITLPGISPIIKILLIMSVGNILNTGFEQQMLLGNPMVANVFEVLDLYVIRFGIAMGRYSFATAAGMFKTIVSVSLLVGANWIVKRMGVTIYPFINVIAISFNDALDSNRGGIYFLPREFTLYNYRNILSNKDIYFASLMSVARTLLGTFTSLSATTLLAFILSRKDFIFRKSLTKFLVITMYFNAGVIPVYMLFKYLGLINKFSVYIIPTLLYALNVIIIRTFIEGLPESLTESAKIDGATDMRILISIIVPLAKPALATVALYIAVFHWNAWFDTYLYASSNQGLSTLQYELMKRLRAASQNLSGSANPDFSQGQSGTIQAVTPQSIRSTMTVVATLPILFVYPFLQKYFISGLTLGGVKG